MPVAAGDLRDLGFGPVAVDALVDFFDHDRDDEGGRHRDRRVGVGEDGRIAVLLRAVEDRDRRGGRDRRLFGEVDDRRAVALADDRARAGAAGLRRRWSLAASPRCRLGRPVVSTAPWRSNSRSIVSRIGGSSPETVEILPPPWIVIGASSCLGSVSGLKPPRALISRSPTRSLTVSLSRRAETTVAASASAATASRAEG